MLFALQISTPAAYHCETKGREHATDSSCYTIAAGVVAKGLSVNNISARRYRHN